MPLLDSVYSSPYLPLVTRQDEGAPASDPVPAHHASPVLAFIIGLAIVTLASVLNAAGLNLTKLDHVRALAFHRLLGALTLSRSTPVLFRKAHGEKTGCVHYGCWECCSTCTYRKFVVPCQSDPVRSLSQLIGSTLALEYMRAGKCQCIRASRHH